MAETTNSPAAVRRSVVIPMYNEARRIEATLATIAGSPIDVDGTEIILVDDGSQDGTADLADKAVADLGLRHVRVVRAAINRGKGAAVRAGMLTATGAHRAFADADLSAGIPDIVECFERLESGRADVVYASRAHPDSEIDDSQPGHRVVTGRVFNLLLRRMGLTEELDTQCGLKGFSASAADTLFSAVTIDGFAFDVEVLALARREAFRVESMPTKWSHADASRVRPIRDGLAMFHDVVSLRRALRRAGPAAAPARGLDPSDISKQELLSELEDAHWWFRAKRDLLAQVLVQHDVAEGRSVDVSRRTGGGLSVLSSRSSAAVGVETDSTAAAIVAARRHPGSLVRGSATRLPLPDGSASVVTLLDVVHAEIDDVAVLAEAARVGAPGATIVVTAPAFRWLWSRHDDLEGHRRRYTAQTLQRTIEAAGLEIDRVTYFHGWLTPVAVVVRKTPARHFVRGEEEQASYFHPTVNRCLLALARIERSWLRRADVPFGLSVLAVARVPAER